MYEIPEDSTFTPATMKVLANMGEKMLSVRRPFPTEHDTEAGWDARKASYEANLGSMARSLGTVLKTIATPGTKVWPDNPRPDCLSLSGSMDGISFGIIFSPNEDGTGRWAIHT